MTNKSTTCSRDFGEEKALQKRLMSLPEVDRFDEINALLDRDFVIGLKLANVILKHKIYFERLLDRGLEEANASEIELWLKYSLPHLGFRRVIAILSNKLSKQPQAVAKASYWLPKFLPQGNEQAARMLNELLKKEKQMLGSEYKGVSSSGQPYKLILKIKSTGEYVVFGGYTLGSKGKKIIVEILNSQDLYPTGGVSGRQES